MSIKPHQPDYSLIFAIGIIMAVGLVLLASAAVVLGQDNFGDKYYHIKHQLYFGFLPGLILLLICSQINYHFWKKIAPYLFGFTLILLALVFIPALSYGHGGAHRWLNLGSVSIQPTEIAKLTLMIFLAAWLANKKGQVKNFEFGFLPFLIYLIIIILLVAPEPDIGTLSVLIISAVAVYFTAGARLLHLFFLTLIGLIGFIFLIFFTPYRMARITTFLNPSRDTLGQSYQINQSIIAIGSGGLSGLGLGQSRQKYQYLPEAIGDSIFAVIAEELGFIFSSILISLFFFFVWRGFYTARRAKDDFAKFLTVGISAWMSWQILINISAMIGLVPLTGLPLPFVSYGSSALIVSMAAVGIMINVSKYTK